MNTEDENGRYEIAGGLRYTHTRASANTAYPLSSG